MQTFDLIPGELYWLKSENGTGWKMVWDLAKHPNLVDIDSNHPVVYVQKHTLKPSDGGLFYEFLAVHKHSDKVICAGLQEFQLDDEIVELKHGPF